MVPPAIIYSQQMQKIEHGLGHALWYPESAIEIGDVGFMKPGTLHHIIIPWIYASSNGRKDTENSYACSIVCVQRMTLLIEMVYPMDSNN